MVQVKDDLTGQRIEGTMLVVIKQVEDYITPSTGKHIARWLVQCDCGSKPFEINGINLKYGRTKSCGCLRREQLIARNKEIKVTHGLVGTRIYNIWRGMIRRCYFPGLKAYANYGGRGIKVCDEWKDSVATFYEWAINNGYQDNLTIDRINNDGNYEPSNCRWTTYKIQGNNTRSCRYIEYDGKKLTISQWAEETGIGRKTIERRLNVGWSVEDALTISPRKKKQ